MKVSRLRWSLSDAVPSVDVGSINGPGTSVSREASPAISLAVDPIESDRNNRLSSSVVAAVFPTVFFLQHRK